MDQQNGTQPSPAQVVDVKPPQAATPQVPDDVAASIQEADQQIAAVPSSPPAVQTAPEPEEVRQPPSNKEDDTTPGEEEASKQASPNPAPKQSASSKKPMAMVVAAIVVGFGLAGLSVYAYMATNQPETSSVANNQEKSGNAAASIDETTAEIDRALGAVDADSDFADSDLSDETLEL